MKGEWRIQCSVSIFFELEKWKMEMQPLSFSPAVRHRDMECAATKWISSETELQKCGGALDQLGMEDGDRSASCWSSARIQSGGVGDVGIAGIRNSLPPHSK
jgi:hypothetical protein